MTLHRDWADADPGGKSRNRHILAAALLAPLDLRTLALECLGLYRDHLSSTGKYCVVPQTQSAAVVYFQIPLMNNLSLTNQSSFSTDLFCQWQGSP